jgi:hypothetical protein
MAPTPLAERPRRRPAGGVFRFRFVAPDVQCPMADGPQRILNTPGSTSHDRLTGTGGERPEFSAPTVILGGSGKSFARQALPGFRFRQFPHRRSSLPARADDDVIVECGRQGFTKLADARGGNNPLHRNGPPDRRIDRKTMGLEPCLPWNQSPCLGRPRPGTRRGRLRRCSSRCRPCRPPRAGRLGSPWEIVSRSPSER